MNRKVIFTTITILWMIFIFLFSSQEATESSKLSDSFIDKTVINVYKVLLFENIRCILFTES